jgi:hypothetical protein
VRRRKRGNLNTWDYIRWRFSVWQTLGTHSNVEIDDLVNEGVICPGMSPNDCYEAIEERDRVRLLRSGFGK